MNNIRFQGKNRIAGYLLYTRSRNLQSFANLQRNCKSYATLDVKLLYILKKL